MLKYWRVWILVIAVLASALVVGMKAYPYGRNGVVIAYVTDDSPANKILKSGMQITSVNSIDIKNVDQWNELTSTLSGNVVLVANGQEYDFNSSENLGINVIDLEKLNLDLGLDLRGGTRVILKTKEKNVSSALIAQTIDILQTRANLFGLKEIKIRPLSDGSGGTLIQIEASGIGSDIVNNLLTKTGKFEAKISKPVSIKDGKAQIVLGQKQFEATVLNNSIVFEGKEVEINETFKADDIDFDLVSVDPNKILILGKVYEGSDIELIFTEAQKTGIQPAQGGFEFFFTVLISKNGAERFAKVTSGIPKSLSLSGGGEYLEDSEIFLYLDGELITNLRIAASLGGVPYTTPQVTGFRETKEDAKKESLQLQTILRSGSIPIKVEVASTDVISPTLGAGFLSSAGLVAGLGALVVFLVVFVRYRKIKIALPMALVSLSEVAVILGIAAINDSIAWMAIFTINIVILSVAWWKKHEVDLLAVLGALSIPLLGAGLSWTIDLPAIGGIVAAIGTGVDQQIIIADETLKGNKKRILTIKEKLKAAFFMVFSAASTTIAAMIPLMFLVAEFVRGFALTTIIGVWIGITLTRPAYSRIIESLLGKEEDVQSQI